MSERQHIPGSPRVSSNLLLRNSQDPLRSHGHRNIHLHCSCFELQIRDPFRKMVTPVVGRPLTQVAFSEAKRNWPFVFGFGVTLTLVYKLSASLDPKDAPKSQFVNPYGHHWPFL